jgi:hypothetical protein
MQTKNTSSRVCNSIPTSEIGVYQTSYSRKCGKVNLNDFKISPKITKAETIRREHLQMKLEAAKLIEDLEEEQKREIDEKRRAIAERIRCRLTKSSDEARQREREEKIQKHNECEALRINGRSKSQGEAIPCANG